MTRKLITLIAAGGLTLGGLTYLQAQDPHGPKHEHGPGPNHHMENPFDHLSESLSLTPDQKAKVQPILDQMKPQLEAIHKEAMKKAHEDMAKAMQEMHDAQKK